MKLLCCLLCFVSLLLGGAEITVHKPSLHFIGRRIVNRPAPQAPGSGVITREKVPELGYRFVFALQNTSNNIVKLATGFNFVRFDSEPGKNLFVLRLSHNIMSIKPRTGGKAFPLILPQESFRIVTLRPGEGTLLNVKCWIPEEKLRSGDKMVVEYSPRNFGRYDFMQLRVRSEAAELKLPGRTKKLSPVVI